jgi:hypothetical protein
MEPAREESKDWAQEVSLEQALVETLVQVRGVPLALVLEVQSEPAREESKDWAQEVSLEQALVETLAQVRGAPLDLVWEVQSEWEQVR